MKFNKDTFKKVILAILFFATFSYFVGWKFASLILISVSFHEYGHVWAMRRKGLETKGFYLLPMLGGVAITTDKYKKSWDHVYILLMGPGWGLLLAVASYLLYFTTKNILFATCAGWMAMFNLFNLLAFAPLDGGQFALNIAQTLDKKYRYLFLIPVWFLSAIPLLLARQFIWLGLLVFTGISSAWTAFHNEKLIHQYERKEITKYGLRHLLVYSEEEGDYIVPPSIQPLSKEERNLALMGYLFIFFGLISIFILASSVPHSSPTEVLLSK